MNVAAACIAVAMTLSACGGSSSSSGPLPAPKPTSTASAAPASNVTFVLIVPAASAVASLQISLGTTVLATANIASGSSLCTARSGGGRSCSAPVQAPAGSDTFVVKAYDGPNASGDVLAGGNVIAAIPSTGSTSVNFTLSGNIAKLQLAIASAYPAVGTPASTSVIVTVFDPSGNIVLGAYASPVTLTNSDSSGATTLSATTVTSASSSVTLSYNGAIPYASATISASAPGVSAASAIFAPAPAFLQTYQSPPSGPPYFTYELGDIVYGPNGEDMWVLSQAPSAVLKVTPTGNMTVYALPDASADPIGIVVGADDNLWFGENQNAAIGKISPITGAITTYALPSGANGAALPYGVTLGNDGNVWFTDKANLVAGSITPSGAITEYPLPANAQVYGITAGPDGNLWIADQGNNAIIKMSTGGSVLASYAIPTANATPYYLTAGPDGNVWFGEFSKGKVAKITPSGSITEYVLPTGNAAGPFHLLAGPDGRIWYGEMGLDVGYGKIGYITTDGSQVRDFVSDGAHVYSIAFDKNATLWYVGDVGQGGFIGATYEVGTFAY